MSENDSAADPYDFIEEDFREEIDNLVSDGEISQRPVPTFHQSPQRANSSFPTTPSPLNTAFHSEHTRTPPNFLNEGFHSQPTPTPPPRANVFSQNATPRRPVFQPRTRK